MRGRCGITIGQWLCAESLSRVLESLIANLLESLWKNYLLERETMLEGTSPYLSQ